MTLSRSTLLASLAALAAAPLAAQSRFTVTPIVGRQTTSPLVDHQLRHDVPLQRADGSTVTGTHYRTRKFRVDPAPAVGARVETPLGRWRGSLTATYQRTQMRYVETVGGIDPREFDGGIGWTGYYPPGMAMQMTGDVVTLGLGVGRELPLAWRFSLDGGLGAGARWVARGKVSDYSCSTDATHEWCHVPFRRDDVIPEANGSLALRTRLTRAVALDVRGTAWSGLSLTRSFVYRRGVPAQEGWAPAFADEKRGPGTQHVYSSLLSVGLVFRP